MPVFRKKPVIIEAMCWEPDGSDAYLVLGWLTGHGVHHKVLEGGRLGVGTLESGDGLDRHAGKPGDWVLRGTKGEFYVCDAEVFAEVYEPVTP